jgi:hypothetical protein
VTTASTETDEYVGTLHDRVDEALGRATGPDEVVEMKGM